MRDYRRTVAQKKLLIGTCRNMPRLTDGPVRCQKFLSLRDFSVHSGIDTSLPLFCYIPLNLLEVSERFLRDPISVLVKKDELTLEGIQQFYIGIGHEEYKLGTLCDL